MSSCVVSIVVPTFRRPAALRRTLWALADAGDQLTASIPGVPGVPGVPGGAALSGGSAWELIVVDDAGGDADTAAVLAAFTRERGPVTVLTQERRGAASARNAGARLASGELVLFIDDDMIVAPDHLIRRRHAHALAGPDALVAARWEFVPELLGAMALTPFGRFRTRLEERFQAEVRGRQLDDGLVEMELLGAAALSLRRELFERLGGFDAAFPVAGAEDQDLSVRARTAGCALVLDTHNLCRHNDHHADLGAYCRRERRSAQTMPFLAVRHPARYGPTAYVRENRPLAHGDPARLVVKKLAKSVLSRPAALAGLARLTRGLERAHAPARWLERLYRLLLGLHLFLGVRDTWAEAQALAGSPALPAAPVLPTAPTRPASRAVTATIVLHDSDAHLADCLAALEAEVSAGRLAVLAVDNASPDGSAALLTARMPAATVIRSEVNLGFAAGANLSWPEVTTPYWLLLNPDVMLDDGALPALVAFLDARPHMAVASPWLRDGPGEPLRYPGRPLPSRRLTLVELLRLHRLLPRRLAAVLLQGAYVRSPADLAGVPETGWVPGAAMLTRRAALEAVGRFDERFFMYGEDLELCWRLRRAGWSVGVCPAAGATHVEGSSSRRAWAEAGVAERIAAGVLQACALARGPGFARTHGWLTRVTYTIEARRPGSGEADRDRRRRARLARDAWAAALRGG